MTELKPCPFCNGVATFNTVDLGKTFYAVCMRCGVRTNAYEHTERAKEIWDRRATMTEINTNSNIAPVWQLPVHGAERTGNAYIPNKSKYHCFVDNITLCGKYHQNTQNYDDGITTESCSVLELPQFACKRCLNLWKKQYRVEG